MSLCRPPGPGLSPSHAARGTAARAVSRPGPSRLCTTRLGHARHKPRMLRGIRGLCPARHVSLLLGSRHNCRSLQCAALASVVLRSSPSAPGPSESPRPHDYTPPGSVDANRRETCVLTRKGRCALTESGSFSRGARTRMRQRHDCRGIRRRRRPAAAAHWPQGRRGRSSRGTSSLATPPPTPRRTPAGSS
jgi:hypothetical protein